MPGHDGTGPNSSGPLTGAGRGYCVLKISGTRDEKPAGFAGLSGKPITGSSDFLRIETAKLYFRVKQAHLALNNLDCRMEMLKRSNSRDAQD
jgi:hypothetical protein